MSIPGCLRWLQLIVPVLVFVQTGCLTRDRAETLAAARSEDAASHREAVPHLARDADPEARSLLRSLGEDSDPQVRGTAIHALGELQDKASVALLVGALEDEATWKRCEQKGLAHCFYEQPIWRAAHDGLEKITGRRVDMESAASRNDLIARWKGTLALE